VEYREGSAMGRVPETIAPGRYRHYKGKFYEVIGIARHSETGEEVVVYRCLYGDFSLWVRPLGMFLEKVLVEGRELPRFACCSEGSAEKGTEK
jgi:hypothetical protein